MYNSVSLVFSAIVLFPVIIPPWFLLNLLLIALIITLACFFFYSDLVLYGRPHIPNWILHQWSRGTTVQITQQHGGGLLLCTVRTLHLLHNSGAPVCGKSLSSWLRGRSQLGQLGCSMWNGTWRHSSRRGDDRGPYYMVNTKLIKLQN